MNINSKSLLVFNLLRSKNLPECTTEASTYGECGYIIWLGKSPVVGRECPSKSTLPQGNDEINAPEESYNVVELQVKQVPLEQPLIIVLDENTAG